MSLSSGQSSSSRCLAGVRTQNETSIFFAGPPGSMDLSVVRKSPSPQSGCLSDDEISAGGEHSPKETQSRSASPSSSESLEPGSGAALPNFDAAEKDPHRTLQRFLSNLDALQAHSVQPGAPFNFGKYNV